jgi:hypothetical protein
MQRQHARLRRAVIHRTRATEVTRHTRHGDNMSLLRFHHARQELLDQRPVAKQVHAEDLLEELLGRVEDGVHDRDARIVDQDAGRAD